MNTSAKNTHNLLAGGERATKQKKALAEMIDSSDSFQSAQDIFASLRSKGENIGLTTIYSQLKLLAAQGELDYMKSESGETLYRKCSTVQHHHHLVCRGCKTTIEIEPPGFEEWAEKVARENHFSDISHVIEITGLCEKCLSHRN
ncbi:MAG: transcriptional repressor [Firmicutes bacterium]|jgi:Fur family ferric uptake transcriptional regulator|nr:transcriptional repressor [Bacillota bacterium]